MSGAFLIDPDAVHLTNHEISQVEDVQYCCYPRSSYYTYMSCISKGSILIVAILCTKYTLCYHLFGLMYAEDHISRYTSDHCSQYHPVYCSNLSPDKTIKTAFLQVFTEAASFIQDGKWILKKAVI